MLFARGTNDSSVLRLGEIRAFDFSGTDRNFFISQLELRIASHPGNKPNRMLIDIEERL